MHSEFRYAKPGRCLICDMKLVEENAVTSHRIYNPTGNSSTPLNVCFRCACLGTFLKVPLTKVTLIEDFGMAALALVMLLLK